MWHKKLIKKGRIDVREHIEEIIRDYESGESSGDIAKKYNTTSQLICRWLKRNGVEIRPNNYFTKQRREKVSKVNSHPKPYMVGEKNWNWKGGITNLNQQIRHCFEMKEWKKKIREKNDYTCQKCWKRGGNNEVDHYPKNFAKILKDNNIKTLEDAKKCEELWNLDNGRVLCLSCHNKTKLGSKSNKL